jgi:hypothetical protein
MAPSRCPRSNALSDDMGMGPGDHLTGFFYDWRWFCKLAIANTTAISR